MNMYIFVLTPALLTDRANFQSCVTVDLSTLKIQVTREEAAYWSEEKFNTSWGDYWTNVHQPRRRKLTLHALQTAASSGAASTSSHFSNLLKRHTLQNGRDFKWKDATRGSPGSSKNVEWFSSWLQRPLKDNKQRERTAALLIFRMIECHWPRTLRLVLALLQRLFISLSQISRADPIRLWQSFILMNAVTPETRWLNQEHIRRLTANRKATSRKNLQKILQPSRIFDGGGLQNICSGRSRALKWTAKSGGGHMSHADQSNPKSERGGNIRARRRTDSRQQIQQRVLAITSTVWVSECKNGQTEYVFAHGIRMTSDRKGYDKSPRRWQVRLAHCERSESRWQRLTVWAKKTSFNWPIDVLQVSNSPPSKRGQEIPVNWLDESHTGQEELRLRKLYETAQLRNAPRSIDWTAKRHF